MNQRIKPITYTLLSVLIIALAAPMTAQSKLRKTGKLTIENKNCTRLKGFVTKQHVKVRIIRDDDRCTKKTLIVPKRQSRTIEIKTLEDDFHACRYDIKLTNVPKEGLGHFVFGDGWVVCQKDWWGICKCKRVDDN